MYSWTISSTTKIGHGVILRPNIVEKSRVTPNAEIAFPRLQKRIRGSLTSSKLERWIGYYDSPILQPAQGTFRSNRYAVYRSLGQAVRQSVGPSAKPSRTFRKPFRPTFRLTRKKSTYKVLRYVNYQRRNLVITAWPASWHSPYRSNLGR